MKSAQLGLDLSEDHGAFAPRPHDAVLADVRTLMRMHADGHLGGELMPEDAHPKIDPASADLAHYFTMGMALNYQRNSYSLWRSCTAAWNDESTKWVFTPRDVNLRSNEELRDALVRHRVALQPNNHVKIWHTIALSLCRLYEGDVRQLFRANGHCISDIKAAIAREKKGFPYLAGPKICNYWLYVMLTYTENQLRDKAALNVAPDTHVINASARLGLVSRAEAEVPTAGKLVAQRWASLLEGSGFDPIDIHTPLWLWSRSGFIPIGRGPIGSGS